MSSTAITIKNFRTEIPGGIDPEDNTIWAFPQIISVNQNNKRTYWRIIVRIGVETKIDGQADATDFIPLVDEYFDSKTPLPDGHVAWYKVLSKIADGKIKKAPPTIVRNGKNIGRSNETNPFTQALRDALGKHNKQAQKAATQEIKIDDVVLKPPMLAQTKLSQKKPIDYTKPLWVQRKYNGIRCVVTLNERPEEDGGNSVVAYSRTRHEFKGFSHLKEELLPVLEYFWESRDIKLYIDGEAYKHGVDLQTISGISRREIDADAVDVKLDYYIFDVFDLEQPDLKYSERKLILDSLFEQFPNLTYCKNVETFSVSSEEEIDLRYKQFLDEGFEGAMLRLDKPYKFSDNDYHSPWLLKMKPVLDAEFKIVNYTAGYKGKSEGTLMFVVETPEGKTFTVNLGMEIDERKKLYDELTTDETLFDRKYKGKMLTVLFDEYSTDKVPVRARTDGIVIRDYE